MNKIIDQFCCWAETKIFFILWLIVCLAILPTGALSGNEEMYYGLAKKSLEPDWNGRFSSFLPSGDYRFISDFLIGSCLQLVGFEATQILGSIFATFAYAVALLALLKRLNLANIYGVTSIVTFILMGQSLVGREWLFEDFEAKIFAYVAVLFAVTYYLAEKRSKMIICLSIATYFHVLVGAAWFGLLVVSRAAHNRAPLYDLKGLMLYTLLSAPIIGLAAWGYLTSVGPSDPSLPSASYIYSYIRQYKMVLPFHSIQAFLLFWLPGLTVFFSALILILSDRQEINCHPRNLLRTLIVVSLFFLVACLAASVFDFDGTFGKFYPYRFTSLLLLLIIFYFALKVRDIETNGEGKLCRALFLTATPFFLTSAITEALIQVYGGVRPDEQKQDLYEQVALQTRPGEIVLISSELEKGLFDFERKLGRPSLVTFKYVPSSKAGLYEWYKRLQFKESIFLNHGPAPSDYPYDYLISTTGKGYRHLVAHHTEIFANESFVFWKVKH